MSIEITQIGKGFLLKARQRLQRPRADIFPFFADAHNLEAITPASLRFEVCLPAATEVREGLLINYRLRLRGVPLRWQSEITAWEPPERFVDEQRRGPYRYWIHEHRFFDEGESTVMVDEVRYGMFCGRILHRAFVAVNLREIFEFRACKLTALFGEA